MRLHGFPRFQEAGKRWPAELAECLLRIPCRLGRVGGYAAKGRTWLAVLRVGGKQRSGERRSVVIEPAMGGIIVEQQTATVQTADGFLSACARCQRRGTRAPAPRSSWTIHFSAARRIAWWAVCSMMLRMSSRNSSGKTTCGVARTCAWK